MPSTSRAGEHIGEEVLPVKAAVGFNIGVEVLQQALGRQLPVGYLLGDGDDVRHISGHYLGSQLGEPGGPVLFIVVLGVVNELYAYIFTGAVKLYYGVWVL